MIRLRIVYILLSQLILIMPVTAQADFRASTTEGCTPMRVKFAIDQTTVDMDTISRIDWYFGRNWATVGHVGPPGSASQR